MIHIVYRRKSDEEQGDQEKRGAEGQRYRGENGNSDEDREQEEVTRLCASKDWARRG